MTLSLAPLGSARRAEAVFEQLRGRILSGELAPGTRLPNERELAEGLEVNRGSVREALKHLEFLELVEVRHGQGTFVKEVGASSSLQLIEVLLLDPSTVTRGLLAELLEFRRHIATHAVELAARNRTEEQLARARALLAHEDEAGREPRRALELDVELNRLLGEATGNLMYRLCTNLFTKLVRRLGPLYYNEARDAARSIATHRELFVSIEARDAGRGRAVLERMLEYSEHAILREAERLEAEGVIAPSGRTRPGGSGAAP